VELFASFHNVASRHVVNPGVAARYVIDLDVLQVCV
jgi:hypothetical protein